MSVLKAICGPTPVGVYEVSGGSGGLSFMAIHAASFGQSSRLDFTPITDLQLASSGEDPFMGGESCFVTASCTDAMVQWWCADPSTTWAEEVDSVLSLPSDPAPSGCLVGVAPAAGAGNRQVLAVTSGTPGSSSTGTPRSRLS